MPGVALHLRESPLRSNANEKVTPHRNIVSLNRLIEANGKKTYIDTLLKDTGFDNEGEIRTAMFDRDGWKRRINGVRTGLVSNKLLLSFI